MTLDNNDTKMSPNKFTVTTWNVNGIKDRVKQQKVLQHLKKMSSDIVFLQELHLKSGGINFLKKQWVGEAFESTYTSKSRGVGILISKSLPFSLISKYSDPEGRYLIIQCEIHGDKYTLINIYSPPSVDMKFLKNIQEIIDSMLTGTIVCAGDLNHIFTELDSSNPTRKSKVPEVLLEFLSLNNLTDIWRQMHPRDKDYTHYSHVKNSYSRLDYIFISKERVEDVMTSKIHDIIISDHAAVTCIMCPLTNKVSHKIWRMNRKHLKDEEFINYIIKHIN